MISAVKVPFEVKGDEPIVRVELVEESPTEVRPLPPVGVVVAIKCPLGSTARNAPAGVPSEVLSVRVGVAAFPSEVPEKPLAVATDKPVTVPFPVPLLFNCV